MKTHTTKQVKPRNLEIGMIERLKNGKQWVVKDIIKGHRIIEVLWECLDPRQGSPTFQYYRPKGSSNSLPLSHQHHIIVD